MSWKHCSANACVPCSCLEAVKALKVIQTVISIDPNTKCGLLNHMLDFWKDYKYMISGVNFQDLSFYLFIYVKYSIVWVCVCVCVVLMLILLHFTAIFQIIQSIRMGMWDEEHTMIEPTMIRHSKISSIPALPRRTNCLKVILPRFVYPWRSYPVCALRHETCNLNKPCSLHSN